MGNTTPSGTASNAKKEELTSEQITQISERVLGSLSLVIQ
jgi:hypothetical protein